MTQMSSLMPAYGLIPEPDLAFHPERDDRHKHPLLGLLSYGPYSRSLLGYVFDPIRIATICPYNQTHLVESLIGEIEQRHSPQERKQYLPEFPGFSKVFGVGLVVAGSGMRIELPSDLDTEIGRSEKPHITLAKHVGNALSALSVHRSEFDVVFILLPMKWQHCFWGEADEDFDLHDYLKAVAAARGVPIQVLNEDRALGYRCRASVGWRLSLAAYSKAGGIPWKLADAEPDTAFIGVSYALRPCDSNGPRYVTCCSQVFDSEGAGLEFLLYETADVRIERDNPYLGRTEMRRLMARSLAIYQRRHSGRAPRRVVVHKTTEFKRDEVDGCFDAWRSAEGLDLIQVNQDSIWRGIQTIRGSDGRPRPDSYPCHRGSYLQIGGQDVLLWTQGNCPSVVVGKGNYYKEGKGIPSPLMLTRYAGHGGWENGCTSVLQLTKMNWNNDSLYDRLPVTLGYARILAKTVKRMPELASTPYEFRLFM